MSAYIRRERSALPTSKRETEKSRCEFLWLNIGALVSSGFLPRRPWFGQLGHSIDGCRAYCLVVLLLISPCSIHTATPPLYLQNSDSTQIPQIPFSLTHSPSSHRYYYSLLPPHPLLPHPHPRPSPPSPPSSSPPPSSSSLTAAASSPPL